MVMYQKHPQTEKQKTKCRQDWTKIFLSLWFIWSCLFNNNTKIMNDKSMVNPSTSQTSFFFKLKQKLQTCDRESHVLPLHCGAQSCVWCAAYVCTQSVLEGSSEVSPCSWWPHSTLVPVSEVAPKTKHKGLSHN